MAANLLYALTGTKRGSLAPFMMPPIPAQPPPDIDQHLLIRKDDGADAQEASHQNNFCLAKNTNRDKIREKLKRIL